MQLAECAHPLVTGNVGNGDGTMMSLVEPCDGDGDGLPRDRTTVR